MNAKQRKALNAKRRSAAEALRRRRFIASLPEDQYQKVLEFIRLFNSRRNSDKVKAFWLMEHTQETIKALLDAARTHH
jgi:hypothetical protein